MDDDNVVFILKQENKELRERVTDLEYKVLCQMEEFLNLKSLVNDCIRRVDGYLPPKDGGSLLNESTLGLSTYSNKIMIQSQNSSLLTSITNKHGTRSTLGNSIFYRTLPAIPSSKRSSNMSSILTNDRSVIKRGLSVNESKLPQPEIRNSSMRPLLKEALSTSPQHSPTTQARGRKSLPAWKPGGGTSPMINSGSSPLSGTATTTRTRTRSAAARVKKSEELQNKSMEPIYIKNEGIVRTFIGGRPVHHYVPSCVSQDYDIHQLEAAPKEKLLLQWVYGYRGRDCRNNLHYLPTGEIVYSIASIVILFNAEEGQQRHYLEHTEEIKCMALHPDRITIATGQSSARCKGEGKEAHIRLWNSVNLSTICVLGFEADFQNSVSCLAFSYADGGEYLCAIDESAEHNISLWDWQRERKIIETQCSPDPVLMVEFHPSDRDTIVTCGRNHLAFWKIDGNQLVKRLALFEKYEKPRIIHCMAFAENGDLLTGDLAGNLIIWRRGTNKVQQVISQAHKGAIFSLCVTKTGDIVSGGGRDGRLVWWNSSYTFTGKEMVFPETSGTIRTISKAGSTNLIIGTTKNAIYMVTNDLQLKVLVPGGHSESLQCLSTPSATLERPDLLIGNKQEFQGIFLTGSIDGHLALWNRTTHQQLWHRDLGSGIYCATFHPFESMIVIGGDKGRWIVLDYTNNEMVSVYTDGGEHINCVQFSPDGTQLAIGSADTNIYIYKGVESCRKFQFHGKCAGHSHSVLHLDWSTDGRFIRSESSDNELLYWTTVNSRQVLASGQLRDKDWATVNCTLAFDCLGLWSCENCYASVGVSMRYRHSPGINSFVNATASSRRRQLIASAESNAITGGLLKLMRFPAIQPKAKFQVYRGHIGEVTNVVMFFDENGLLTVGGRDCAILQWLIV